MKRYTYIGRCVIAASVLAIGYGIACAAEIDELSEDTLDVPGAASEADLEASRGKQGIDILSVSQETNASQQAQVNNNSLSGVTTGDNLVESGAFRGATGNTTLIQNSGNQVVIQENTIYNITFAP